MKFLWYIVAVVLLIVWTAMATCWGTLTVMWFWLRGGWSISITSLIVWLLVFYLGSTLLKSLKGNQKPVDKN